MRPECSHILSICSTHSCRDRSRRGLLPLVQGQKTTAAVIISMCWPSAALICAVVPQLQRCKLLCPGYEVCWMRKWTWYPGAVPAVGVAASCSGVGRRLRAALCWTGSSASPVSHSSVIQFSTRSNETLLAGT